MVRNRILAAALISAVFSMTASAAAKDEAAGHMKAVASGNVDQIMSNYSEHAVFQWVGGPLDGVYSGKDAIRGVWKKFSKAMTPLNLSVEEIQENANPKGSTVSAKVIYSGKKTLKIRYVMVYRGGKLVNEIWQIDPKMETGY